MMNRDKSTGVAILLFLIAGVLMYNIIPASRDLVDVYLPATRLLLAGVSPYNHPGFYNPVWVLLMFIPLVLVPEQMATVILFIVGGCAFIYAFKRMELSRVSIIILMLSISVVNTLLLGNIEWVVLLGLLMSRPWGMFLLILKPQMAVGVVLVWIWDEYKSDGIKGVVKLLSPVLATTLISTLIYGFPMNTPTDTWWNVSMFPYLIPIGLAFLVYAFQKRDELAGLSVGPLVSPYVTLSSWIGWLVFVARSKWLLLAFSLGLWAEHIVRGSYG